MNPILLYLSCVVILIGSLVWTTSAQGGHDFESERTRVLNIYANPRVDDVTRIRNIPLAVDFLDKDSDQVEMTPEQRSRSANALRIYMKQIIVDGTPPQGGIWDFVGRQIIQLVIDVAYFQWSQESDQN